MRTHKAARAFTVTELLISMTIMGIVLALAVVEFAMVFNHNNLMNYNLSADQNARIAMAKVTNEFRQAMPDITDFSANYPVVVSPSPPPPSTAPVASNSAVFYRVHNGPGGLVAPVPTDRFGDPTPCYDIVTLTYDSVGHTITRTITLQTNAHCPTPSTQTDVIARNVTGFSISAEAPQLFDIDLQTTATGGGYGIYDLNTQVALGYKP